MSTLLRPFSVYFPDSSIILGSYFFKFVQKKLYKFLRGFLFFFLRIYFTCWLFPAQSFINAFRCPPSVNHNRGNNSGSVLVMLSLKVKSYSAIYAPNLPFLAVPVENKRIRELRYRTVNLWKLQQKWSTSHSFTNFYRTCLWFRQLPEYIFFVILSKIIHAVFLYTNVSSFDFKFWKIIRIEVSYHYEILHFFDVNWELHLILFSFQSTNYIIGVKEEKKIINKLF